jgi:hypothetical protein
MGELLKEFDGRGNNQHSKEGGVATVVTRTEAAERAGISERQRVTAIRVANVPAAKFEAAVEKERPATVTAFGGGWANKFDPFLPECSA